MNNNTENTQAQRVPQRQPDLQDAALAMRELFDAHLAYDEKHDAWLRWTGMYWQDTNQAKTELDRMATEALRSVGCSISNAGKLDGTIRLAKAAMRREFVERKNVVNFNNGTLEIERYVNEQDKVMWRFGRLGEHRIEDNLRRCMPYDLDQAGSHVAISRFLNDSIPDPLARECLLAHIGLALLQDTTLHYSVILHGAPRSGKSTVMALARAVCGIATNLQAADWTPKDVFDSDLEAKRTRFKRKNEPVACIDEVPAAALRGEEIFKIMSAHGGVPMRGIGRDDEIDTVWVPKIIMATNNTPSFKDASGAIAERLIPIKVPNHRSEGQRDLGLMEKLETEVGAFAATCLKAAIETKNRGYYSRSRGQMNTLAGWAQIGNPLRSFVADHCKLGAKQKVTIAELYKKYSEVLEAAGMRPLQQANLTAELLDMNLGIERKLARGTWTDRGVKKSGVARSLVGISLKTEADATDVMEDFSEDDYRPAIETDQEIGERANQLLAEKRYEEAYHAVLEMRNAEDREYALKVMRDAKVIPFSAERRDNSLFELTSAA